MAADNEISLLNRGSTQSKAASDNWAPQPAEEGDEVRQPSVKFLPQEYGLPSPDQRCLESELASNHKDPAESRQSDATEARLSLSIDTSQISVRSTDTTLEYFDAPLSEEQPVEAGGPVAEKDDEVVTVNVNRLVEEKEAELKLSSTAEQMTHLTEGLKADEEGETQEAETFEYVFETDLEQQAKEEEVQCENEDGLDILLSLKREDAATLDQGENPGNYFAIFTLFLDLLFQTLLDMVENQNSMIYAMF